MDRSDGKTKEAPHVTSVERAFLLWKRWRRNRANTRLRSFQKPSAGQKSRCTGCFSILVQFRYAEYSEETGRYKLGIRFFELGVRVSRMWDIRSTAMPHMQHLNYAFGEMVQLGTEDRGQVLYLEKLDSSLLISQTVSLHF